MMKRNKHQTVYEAVIISVCGLAFTLLIGYLYQYNAIFVGKTQAFVFVIFGIIGSILYITYKFWGLRNYFFVFTFLFIFYILRSPMRHVGLIFMHLIYMAFFAASVYLYLRYFYPNLKQLVIGKFIVLTGLSASSMFLYFLIVGLIIKNNSYFYTRFAEETLTFRSLLAGMTFYGFLIGSGLGIGFEIGEMLNSRLFKRVSIK